MSYSYGSQESTIIDADKNEWVYQESVKVKLRMYKITFSRKRAVPNSELAIPY